MIQILLLIPLISQVKTGEWFTVRGGFCIDKCKYHNDEFYSYWCHVTDLNKVYSDGMYAHGIWGGWGFDNKGPDTHLKWDKCVPSEVYPDDNIETFK